MKKLLLLAVLFLLGCPAEKPPASPSPYDGLKFDSSYTNGLPDTERQVYWYADEGIQYMPLDVLYSINRPMGGDSTFGLYDERFLEHPERLGFLPNLGKPGMPPIGLSVSSDPSYIPMAGLNCSTCHTSLIQSRGRAVLIDGGSSLFAIDRFIKEMVLATVGTLANPVEFIKFNQRFQERLAARSGLPGASLKAKQKDEALEKLLDTQEHSDFAEALKENRNIPSSALKALDAAKSRSPKLFGASRDSSRFDSGAFPTSGDLDSGVGLYAYMVKRFLFFYAQTKFAVNPPTALTGESGLGRSNPWSVTKNMLSANYEHIPQDQWPQEVGGPVNTPYLWGFDQQHWVFWTGVTNSMLERNLAQGVALVTDFNWKTFDTTVSAKKLDFISSFAKKITPPKWPEDLLGKIDRNLATSGKPIFEKHCLGCHKPFDPKAGSGSGELNYFDVGTDAEYYKGQIAKLNGKDLFQDILSPFLSRVKKGVFDREGLTDPSALQPGRFPTVWKAPTGNKFVAKPLWGAWATPPFLHNGSVRSIRELLKKPADRSKSFWIGNLEYDPADLGFVSTPVYFSSQLEVQCPKGCAGNGNGGHSYGTDLSEAEKNALIEFLKGYGSDQ